MPIKAVIFDLDGTLVNSLQDLTDAMNFGLKSLRMPILSAKKCKMLIGEGVNTFVKKALPADKQNLHPKLLELMRKKYRRICLNNTRAYPGIKTLLKNLKKRHIRLAVLTNKDKDVSTRIVKAIFGADIFDFIIGTKNGVSVKPSPQAAKKIIRDMKLTSKNFILVGDGQTDIQAAHAAKMTSVAVLWGFRNKTSLRKEKPDKIIDKPVRLLDLIA